MKIIALLHVDQFFYWVHSPMVDLYYKYSANGALTHFLFGVSCEYQSVALVVRLWPVIDAPALVADRLTNLAGV